VTVDNTCTYVMYKGCDQTWDTCGANNAWGPSANNQANFAGCLHIAVPTYPQDATTSLDLNPHSSTPSEVDELYAQYRADEAYYEYGEYIGPSKEQIAGFENP